MLKGAHAPCHHKRADRFTSFVQYYGSVVRRYYGSIEGRIVGMDRSASDAVRLTLDRVHLERISLKRTPKKVRISLHSDAVFGIDPKPGMTVMTTGHLPPPSGPVEPGAFGGFDRRCG